MLFATTVSGLFSIDIKTKEVSLLKKSNIGFFGIDKYNDMLLVAERVNLSNTCNTHKHSSDVILYSVDGNNNISKFSNVYDVSDVHQIGVDGDDLLLTDTGKNRIAIFDLVEQKVVNYIDFGDMREDVNHINSIHIDSSYILIGLKNFPIFNSQIALIDDVNDDVRIKDLGFGTLHNIEGFSDSILMCDSHNGIIYSSLLPEPFIFTNRKWTRGLAVSKDKIFVGFSHVGERGERYRKRLNGMVSVYDYDGNYIDDVIIPKCGQVFDLFYWE